MNKPRHLPCSFSCSPSRSTPRPPNRGGKDRLRDRHHHPQGRRAPTLKVSDTVKVHYRGTPETGQEFDSSYKRGQPATFPLTRAIPGWTKGAEDQGRQGQAGLPAQPWPMANQNVQGIPPGSTLIFEVELLDIAR